MPVQEECRAFHSTTQHHRGFGDGGSGCESCGLALPETQYRKLLDLPVHAYNPNTWWGQRVVKSMRPDWAAQLAILCFDQVYPRLASTPHTTKTDLDLLILLFQSARC